MRERPILFNDAMVRAILDGRKTETRRVTKPQLGRDIRILRNPYGDVGDLVYVRECWATAKRLDDKSPRRIGEMAEEAGFVPGAPIWYRSDSRYNMWTALGDAHTTWGGKGKGRPSIHMPKWASRIWLRVAGVRIERLQQITRSDIRAEGVSLNAEFGENYRDAYLRQWVSLWDGINAGRGYPWASDPWVWVVSFEVVSTTGKPT